MAHLEKSVVTLRIFGDDLVPSEISKLLGANPSFSQIKGEEIVGHKTGQIRAAKTGCWKLEATVQEPENIDDQVQEILDKLSQDMSVWSSLSSNYSVNLFCGLFMCGTNEGLSVSSRTLSALGQRGIELGFDIYSN